MKINSVSKSRLQDFEKCPLMAYKKIRDTSAFESNQAIEIGNLTHELAEKRIADFANIEFHIQNIAQRYDLVTIDTVNSMLENKNIESFYSDIQVIAIEEPISVSMPEVREGFVFSARFDIVSFAEIDEQRYIIVDDLKSSPAIKKEIDLEAIFYAYLAYEKYGGLPVIFRRISLSSNQVFKEIFSVNRIEKMKPNIIFKAMQYMEDMESEMLPEYNPGKHCLYCPYISTCKGRKEINSLHNKFKASIWAKMYAKRYEGEVKSAAQEVLNRQYLPLPGEEVVLLPFLRNRYGVTAKTSESWQLAKRNLKKADIINLLIETGDISDFISNLDIKFNEELAEKLSREYDIEMKRVVKTSISLVETGDNNEFEE